MRSWSRRGWTVRHHVLLGLLVAFLSTSRAALVNRTIDDSILGDISTGQRPIYLPASGSWDDQTCSGCAIQPDKSLAFDGTWTAATYNPSLKNINITLSFTGVSIWVFFILANANQHGPTITTNTECNFTLDGQHAGNFSHQPDMSTYDLQYNATVFSATGLSNSSHQLVISTNDVPYNVFVNFDYAIYTVDLSDSLASTTNPTSSISTSNATLATHASSPSNRNTVGIVVGCVVGVLSVIIIVCMLFFIRRLRMAQKLDVNMPQAVLEFNQPPTDGNRDNVASHIPWHNTIYSSSQPPNSGAFTGSPGRSPPSSNFSSDPSSPLTALLPLRRDNQTPRNGSSKNQNELRAVRQMEIDQRLQNAQQQMNALTSRQSVSRGPGRMPAGVEQDEMESMREQLRRLTGQIEQLQSERQSDWAMGLSDDPPPAYT